jgi:hypothetical protein
MIEKISNLPSWRIGDFVFTFDQLEKLYYSIGAELLDVAVENGDFDMDPPDEYRKAKAITE